MKDSYVVTARDRVVLDAISNEIIRNIELSDRVNPYIKAADDSIKDILMQYELSKSNIDDIVKQIREVL